MRQEIIDLFDKVEKFNIQQLKKYWGLNNADSSDDKDIQDLRNRFLRFRYQLPEMINNLKDGEMIGIRRYTTEKYKWERYYFIPFIGKLSDIEKLFRKYFLYGNMIRSQVIKKSKDAEIIKHARGYITGEEKINLTHDEDCFFLKIIWGDNTSFILEQPQIQVYGFNYEKAVMSRFDRPWLGDLSDFMADSELYVCTVDDVMEQADTFIRDNINKNPVFGLEHLEQLLDK